MRMRHISVLATVFLMFAICAGWCAETKIVVVNMERVIEAFPETKTANLLLEKQVEEFETENKEMLAELERLNKEFENINNEAKSKVLNEEARASKVKNAEGKLTELKEYKFKIQKKVALWQNQITDQKVRMRMQIVSKLRKIIQEYAENKGYFLVLDSSSMGRNGVETVVYNPQGIDITDEVLKIIEKK